MDLRTHGLVNLGPVHAQLWPARAVEMALARKEGQLAANGALVARTGAYTGRAAKDKYLVRRPAERSPARASAPSINRWSRPPSSGCGNGRRRISRGASSSSSTAGPAPIPPIASACGSSPKTPGRRCSPVACSSPRPPRSMPRFKPNLLILHAPRLQFDPGRDQTRSEVGVMLDLDEHRVLIAGTQYAGEIKKSVFTFLNYWMPPRDVFPMHCSATIGPAGDTALFFGLSGTGKTTLSADPERRLIGDDEHGWSPTGVFNFEGGCYAKCIRLSHDGRAANLGRDPLRQHAGKRGPRTPTTREPDYDDGSLTENTRAAYPLDYIDNIEPSGARRASAALLFLTCDAFGVLPPLCEADAGAGAVSFSVGLHGEGRRHRGGRQGADGDVQHLFRGSVSGPARPCVTPGCSSDGCTNIERQVWLVNTGWTGGPYGVGQRFPLEMTRRLVRGGLERRARSGGIHARSGLRRPGPESVPRRAGRAVATPPRLGRWIGVRSGRAQIGGAVPQQLQGIRGARRARKCERRGQASPDPSPFGGLRRAAAKCIE